MVGSFTEASFSLSAYDGQTVRVRFDFDTVDSALQRLRGLPGRRRRRDGRQPSTGADGTTGRPVLRLQAPADRLRRLYLQRSRRRHAQLLLELRRRHDRNRRDSHSRLSGLRNVHGDARRQQRDEQLQPRVHDRRGHEPGADRGRRRTLRRRPGRARGLRRLRLLRPRWRHADLQLELRRRSDRQRRRTLRTSIPLPDLQRLPDGQRRQRHVPGVGDDRGDRGRHAAGGGHEPGRFGARRPPRDPELDRHGQRRDGRVRVPVRPALLDSTHRRPQLRRRDRRRRTDAEGRRRRRVGHGPRGCSRRRPTTSRSRRATRQETGASCPTWRR